MSGNSQQRRQERRREQRLVDAVLRRIPTKYKWDLGSLGLGMGLRFAAGDISQFFYWTGIVVVYLAVLSLGRHVWEEHRLWARLPWARKITTLTLCSVFAVMWTINVFASAPLPVGAYATLGNYGTSDYAPIKPWNATMYQDGRLDIHNPSDADYSDLDLALRSDLWIGGAAQLSTIPNVSFIKLEEPGRPRFGGIWLGGTDKNGNPVALPIPQDTPIDLSGPTGIRLTCTKLPHGSTLNLALILISFNQAGKGGLFPPKLFSEKRPPTYVRVTGTYRAHGRVRSIDDKFPVSKMN